MELALVCAVGVFGFLVGEKRRSQLLRWLGKPVASGAFVAAAWSRGALDSAYGRWVLAALVFSMLGDILLLPASTLLFGLGSFLVGHLLFAAAFVARGVSWPVATGVAVVAAGAALPVARWLLPHVKGGMRAPVVAYMTAISAMVSLAAASYARAPAPLLLGGALAFYFSDLSVARDRFVQHDFFNRLWGVPLYYGAQLLFAWSVTRA
jgi:uncharacterized membrane protein YhhN